MVVLTCVDLHFQMFSYLSVWYLSVGLGFAAGNNWLLGIFFGPRRAYLNGTSAANPSSLRPSQTTSQFSRDWGGGYRCALCCWSAVFLSIIFVSICQNLSVFVSILLVIFFWRLEVAMWLFCICSLFLVCSSKFFPWELFKLGPSESTFP